VTAVPHPGCTASANPYASGTALVKPRKRQPPVVDTVAMPARSPIQQASLITTEPVHAEPLSLEQLLNLAMAQHPDLAVARGRVEEARGKMIQAGLPPNPMFGWEGDDMGEDEDGAGTQGPMYAQEFVLGNKLKLAQAAAAHGITVADWQAVTRLHELATRVRSAYYEVLAAEREVQVQRQNADLLQGAVVKIRRILETPLLGLSKADLLHAELEERQSRMQVQVAEQRWEAAWRTLAATVGVPELIRRPLYSQREQSLVELAGLTSRLPGMVVPVPHPFLLMGLAQGMTRIEWDAAQPLDQPAPDLVWSEILPLVLSRSSELRAAQAAVLQAEMEASRAQAENTPNLHLKVRPFYDFGAHDPQLKVEAGFNLPLCDRNQGNIMAAHAAVARTQAEVRQVELQLTERLAAAFRRYDEARRRVDTYQRDILPKAQEALLATERLQLERFNYLQILEAQRTLNQARLEHVQALGELWKAVSEILGLMQQ
jgi:cobalt-zinc-cadmium efflux system outer membrane protein